MHVNYPTSRTILSMMLALALPASGLATACGPAGTGKRPPAGVDSLSPDAPTADAPTADSRPAAVPARTLFEGEWHIITLDGVPVQLLPGSLAVPHLIFSESRISAYSGCNTAGGSIEWLASGFRLVGEMVSTLIGCGPLTDQESALFSVLTEATLVLEGAVLTLRANGHVLTLARP